MSESAIDVIRRYQEQSDSKDLTWEVLPPLCEAEIQACEAICKKRGLIYPEKLKELHRFSAGLTQGDTSFHFTVSEVEYDTGRYLPNAISFMSDECGDFWVIDTLLDPQRLGPIFFVCHSPSIIVYHAYDLAAFLAALLLDQKKIPGDGNIWEGEGGQIQGDWIVFDLQSEHVGSGAPLYLYYDYNDDDSRLQRDGSSLIFRLKRRHRNWWQRFRDGWR